MAPKKKPALQKLIKNSKQQDVKSELIASSSSTVSSPYFSPNFKHNKNRKLGMNARKDLRKIKQNPLEQTKVSKGESPKKIGKSTKLNITTLDNIENIKDVETINTKSEQAEWEPLNWEIIFNNIKKMRSDSSAPVDTMGCDKCYDENITEKEKHFNILLALMLSSRTKDEVTYAVMNKLKKSIIPLTPENVLKIKKNDLQELLKPAAFYRSKSDFITRTSQILVEKYNSDIPSSLEELMGLPGVSSKIANICMNVAWNVITGIGVDVHVHRIANRLKWVRKETKTPEDTRIQLESWAPKEIWGDINHLLVGFGQTMCKAIKPKCEICLNKQVCPYNSPVLSKSNQIKVLDW